MNDVEQALSLALHQTGFPFEHFAFQAAQHLGWNTRSNRLYIDPEEHKTREMDLLCYRISKGAEHFNPGQTLPQRAKRISGGQYTPPSFEMSMARKDLRLMVEEAARGGQSLAMVPALAALLDAGIARGEGALDVAAAVRVPG